MKAPTNKQKYEKIGDKKRTTPAVTLCDGLPLQFAEYLDSVRSLPFDAEPPYEEYRMLFMSVLDDLGQHADGDYDWMHLNGGRGWDAAINKNLTYMDTVIQTHQTNVKEDTVIKEEADNINSCNSNNNLHNNNNCNCNCNNNNYNSNNHYQQLNYTNKNYSIWLTDHYLQLNKNHNLPCQPLVVKTISCITTELINLELNMKATTIDKSNINNNKWLMITKNTKDSGQNYAAIKIFFENFINII